MKYSKAQIERNINAWLDELENGTSSNRADGHQQTTGALKRRNGSMCCLGVAADKVLHCESYFDPATKSYIFIDKNGNKNRDVLTKDMANALGLQHVDGSYEYDYHSLVNDNDDKGKSFKEIAAIIRSKPEGLFKENYRIKKAK